MADILNIEQFLLKSESIPVVDVRSPAEFENGHIPGAFSIPIFTNDAITPNTIPRTVPIKANTTIRPKKFSMFSIILFIIQVIFNNCIIDFSHSRTSPSSTFCC